MDGIHLASIHLKYSIQKRTRLVTAAKHDKRLPAHCREPDFDIKSQGLPIELDDFL
jgi:hypothetical protein